MIRKSSLFAALVAAIAVVGVGSFAHAQDAAKKGAAKKGGAKKGGHAGGKVTSVDATAKSFVISHKAATAGAAPVEITVTTSDKTTFTKFEAGATTAAPATFQDVKKGERVRVTGKPDGENKIAATSVIIGRAPGAGKGKKKAPEGEKKAPAGGANGAK